MIFDQITVRVRERKRERERERERESVLLLGLLLLNSKKLLFCENSIMFSHETRKTIYSKNFSVSSIRNPRYVLFYRFNLFNFKCKKSSVRSVFNVRSCWHVSFETTVSHKKMTYLLDFSLKFVKTRGV